MKKILLILLLILVYNFAFSTRQQPDILYYDSLKLDLSTGWGHPSPLQIYFIQKDFKYPFKSFSTGNYRGHIAVWEIKNGKLFLNEILIEKHRKIASSLVHWWMDKKGSISSNIYDYANDRIYKSKNPRRFKIKAKQNDNNKNVFADWFSGVLECRLVNDSNYSTISTYYFQIQNGIIVKTEKNIEGETFDNLSLQKMYENFITYYYRLTEEKIEIDTGLYRLNSNWYNQSPFLQYFDYDPLMWKFNWENEEQSGAPNCTWQIENNKLYLKEIRLYYGLRYDTVYSENIELKTIFENQIDNERIFANWVNGIFLITFGYQKENYEHYWDDFQETGYMFCEIEEGIIIDEIFLNHDFDFEEIPDNIDKTQKKMIEEYLRKLSL